MENLNPSKLNKQINLSISKSELTSTIDEQNLNHNEQVRKEEKTQSNEVSFIKAFLRENLDTFDTPSTKALFKIFLSRHILLKVFYILFLLASTGLASYLVIESIMNYLAFDVTTKSRTIYETPTLFPKVAFCNRNMYQTKYAYDLLQSYEYQDPSLLSIEEKKLLGHDLNDILISCYFDNTECSSSDFTYTFDLMYGNCYTFNSGFNENGTKVNLKESLIPGSLHGLKLNIYVNVYQSLFETLGFMNGLGAVFHIGNSSYENIDEGIFLSPGFETFIVVDREFKSMLPKPYSNCEIDSNSSQFIQGLDVYNLILESGNKYSQLVCFVQCYQKYIFNKYNCTSYFFPSFLVVSQCTEDYSNNHISEFFDKNFINKNCLSSCPLECDHSFYKRFLSFSQLNPHDYDIELLSPNILSDFFNRTFDEETAAKSFIQVNIFYQSLSYTLTTELPQWDAIALFGSIGGNLGLFLGVSVFSLCELVEFTAEIYLVFKKTKSMCPA
jgi:hypothetical protein